jgi:hypothetical protein
MSTERGLTHAVMEGQGAYNKHAKLQAEGAALALPVLEKAIREIEVDAGEYPLVVADYGSSQGKNSMIPMQATIKGLRKRIGPDRAISVYHIDQPANDFNSLFEVLQVDRNSYIAGEAEVYSAAVGKSFYEQVLPSGFVHLGWCSYAAMWLSLLPALIPGHFISVRSTGTVRAAFERQAAQDWEKFLILRARELRPGGRLLVVLPCVSDDGSAGLEPMFDQGNAVLEEMAADGVITPEERSGMTLTNHVRQKRELLAPFKDSGTFQQLTVEDFKMLELTDSAWVQYQQDRNMETLASRRALFFRSAFVPSLACALNPGHAGNGTALSTFGDQLQQRLIRRFASLSMPLHTLVQTMLMAKKE